MTAGGTITYTLDATNDGPSDAANVTVTDTLPAGVTFVSVNASNGGWTCNNTGNISVTCTRPLLAAGTDAPTVRVRVTAPTQGARLTNTATVAATTPDPDPSNDTDTFITRVGPSADLSLVKRGPNTVTPGSTIRYSLVVSNAGPDRARDIVVVDDLPDGVTFISASGVGWSCDNNANRSVRCERPSLASGDEAPPITLVVRSSTSADDITNQASVRASTFDPTSANNSGSAATTVTNHGGGGSDDDGPRTDGGIMPDTGAGETQGLLALALALLVVGGVLWAFGRRRQSERCRY